MKSKITFLIILGIIFAFLPLFMNIPRFISKDRYITSNYNSEKNFDRNNIKISDISGKIHIDNNWTAAKSAGLCIGNGTYSEPYIIKDLVIDGGGSGSGILIENSDVYFKIENCTIYNSGIVEGGIKLTFSTNGKLINNNCSSNFYGIRLWFSDYNEISGNIIENNNDGGINLWESSNNNVSENIASNNSGSAIWVGGGDNNNILGNFLNSNTNGMLLTSSDNNIVSGNIAIENTNAGIELHNCDNNKILGNTLTNNRYGIETRESTFNTISGNNAGNNLFGIKLSQSYENTMYFNTLCNASFESSSHKWHSDKKMTYTYNGNNFTNYLGNYWNNYMGIDTNNDGIGDTTFESSEGGDSDNYPLMEPIKNYEIIEILEPSEGGGIPGYKLFLLLGILSVVAIILSKKLKK